MTCQRTSLHSGAVKARRQSATSLPLDRFMPALSLFLGFSSGLLGAVSTGRAQAVDATWHVIACGGENVLAGGGYQATATIGQAVVTDTAIDNAQHKLSAGYWLEVATAGCCNGDVNNDGRINGMDIGVFVGAILNPPAPGSPEFCRANINLDGEVNAADVAPFVVMLLQNPPPCM